MPARHTGVLQAKLLLQQYNRLSFANEKSEQ
jgi:hypothetical protein